jgi:hypothetical protein
MKQENELLVQFARNVVANAFDQAVDVATRCAKAGVRGIVKAPSSQNESSVADARDLAIAVAAAESALASFFSNMELLGIFKIILSQENDGQINLEDLVAAPILSKFLADGWLHEYSKYPQELAKWQI